MDADELAAWLRLIEAPGVGRAAARRLLAARGSPQAAARQLPGPPEQFAASVDTTLAWLNADASHHVIALGDPAYPAALLESPDPPLLLYTIGRLERLQAPALAIVGSRNASVQGRENARAFAEHLSRAGLTIVSGLALGIDAAAHEGALDSPANTIAVVATGLDQVYPRRHEALAKRIAAEGLIVSEFALGMPPLRENFPQRNRIIAGLSRGTLVVEATLQSGSLITARLALEAGRDVFAMPGSIHSPQAKGCHALIKQGAKLVESAQDVLEELGTLGPAPPTAEAATGKSEARTRIDPLLEALGHDPIGLDELVSRTGESAATLAAKLLDLELAGHIERLPGQRFQRIGHA